MGCITSSCGSGTRREWVLVARGEGFFFIVLNRPEVIAAIRGARGLIEEEFEVDLVRVAKDIMLISKAEYVPVATGALLASGRVETGNFPGVDIGIELKYGGPPDYAVAVHEVNKNYRNGRQWKYLETPAKLYPTEESMTVSMRRSLAGKIGGISRSASRGNFMP